MPSSSTGQSEHAYRMLENILQPHIWSPLVKTIKTENCLCWNLLSTCMTCQHRRFCILIIISVPMYIDGKGILCACKQTGMCFHTLLIMLCYLSGEAHGILLHVCTLALTCNLEFSELDVKGIRRFLVSLSDMSPHHDPMSLRCFCLI